MRPLASIIISIACCTSAAGAFVKLKAVSAEPTAEELVARNTEAKGGLAKIKAITSIRMIGRFQQGDFSATVGQEAKAPNLLRETFTIQNMTQIQAYDGSVGWQISPFQGRKDPELLGEDDVRDLVEQADFYGPLIDYRQKGHTIEYAGRIVVDGDDVYRLKVTLKNGDIYFYDLDPDTYLEIRIETQQFIRGSVRERVSEVGSYKLVNGVYYPFSVEIGPKRNPSARAKITYEKIEPNVDINDSAFRMKR